MTRSPVNESPSTEGQPLRIVDALSFLCEVALLVLLAVSGSRLGHELVGRILWAIALPAAATAVWGLWMAPTSRRRFDDPWRFIAQIAVFVAAAVLAALARLTPWGIALAVVGVATFGLTRRRGGRTSR
jgi:hypothetical protein